MARMYGASLRPCCPQCWVPPSRNNGRPRQREKGSWRQDWAQDIDEAEQERHSMEVLGLMIARCWNGDARAYLKHYYDAEPVWGATPYAV